MAFFVLLAIMVIAWIVVDRGDNDSSTDKVIEALNELGLSVQQFVRGNTVVAMVEGLEQNPELEERAPEITRKATVAVHLLNLSTLEARLQHTQEQLSGAQKVANRHAAKCYKDEVTRLEAEVQRLMALFLKAQQDIEAFMKHGGSAPLVNSD